MIVLVCPVILVGKEQSNDLSISAGLVRCKVCIMAFLQKGFGVVVIRSALCP